MSVELYAEISAFPAFTPYYSQHQQKKKVIGTACTEHFPMAVNVTGLSQHCCVIRTHL